MRLSTKRGMLCVWGSKIEVPHIIPGLDLGLAVCSNEFVAKACSVVQNWTREDIEHGKYETAPPTAANSAYRRM
jgi:hypothetical protein